MLFMIIDKYNIYIFKILNYYCMGKLSSLLNRFVRSNCWVDSFKFYFVSTELQLKCDWDLITDQEPNFYASVQF